MNRTLSESEMAALLERAAALQAEAARKAEKRPGLTLAELSEVADEVGLDPAFVRQAAGEMFGPERKALPARKEVTDTQISVERWVQGPLSEDAWEDLVFELKHRFETSQAMRKASGMPEEYGKGQIETIGRSREWHHTSMSGIETRVLVRPRGDQLSVRLSQKVGWGTPIAEAATYGLAISGLLFGVSMAATDTPLIAVLVSLVSLMTLIPLIRMLDIKWRAKKHERLETLADRALEILQSHRVEPTETKARSEEHPAKPLIEIPDEQLTDEAIQMHRGRTKT